MSYSVNGLTGAVDHTSAANFNSWEAIGANALTAEPLIIQAQHSGSSTKGLPREQESLTGPYEKAQKSREQDLNGLEPVGCESREDENASLVRRPRPETPGNEPIQERQRSPTLIDLDQDGKSWMNMPKFERDADSVSCTSLLDANNEDLTHIRNLSDADTRNSVVTGFGAGLGYGARSYARSGAESGYYEDRNRITIADIHRRDNLQNYDRAEDTQLLRQQLAQLQTVLYGESTWTDMWPTLFKVSCPSSKKVETYMEAPTITVHDYREHPHLQSTRPLFDETLWIAQHRGTPFVVYKYYECGMTLHDSNESEFGDDDDHDDATAPGPVKATRESVWIRGHSFRSIVSQMLQHTAGLKAYWQRNGFNGKTLNAPYVFLYHFRADIVSFIESCSRHKTALKMLVDYMTKQSAQDFARTKEFFREGRVTHALMPYLFAPCQLIMLTGGSEVAVLEQTTPLFEPSENSFKSGWECEANSIAFDGEFRRRREAVNIKMPDNADEARITDLVVYPLQYGTPQLQKELLQRGEIFFKCHQRQYVTRVTDRNSGYLGENRYMVDVGAYYSIHGKSKVPGKILKDLDPNDKKFLLQLPPDILGFRMSDKKWEKLRVLDLEPVQWNIKAFDNLVIEEKSKELIEALIKNKIESNKTIDFVDGKGNGLILLLHGGPGTGKTFTAESVAEIAKKPLYRATCGDIGTDPAHVEKYLKSVFYLGQRWNCIVLLDEADIFLEERSLGDLERNALVTVFLRALEYYSGILILTTNRVGCFDSAFTSRVQLALPYPPLNKTQRLRVWQNFLDRLKLVQEDMCLNEIEAHVSELAAFQMNGRQIRNAINSARQLARFRATPLSLDHLMHVINISKGFDKYIEDVRGLDEQQFARENMHY